MDFNKFAEKVTEQFNSMAESDVYVVNVTKDESWPHYLASFPKGTNPIYLERTEHDCQTCRQFIKYIANAVTINDDGTLTTVWDVDGLEEPYATVAKAMATLISSSSITNIFLHNEKHAGKAVTQQLLKDGSVKTWKHFHAEIPDRFYIRDISTARGKAQSRAQVHERSLSEITLASIKTVLELITDNAIYRGAEFKKSLESFYSMKQAYEVASVKNSYAWSTYKLPGAGIRNTVIGSLLIDLSKGDDLEAAVKSFEAKVAPSNYKRPKAIVTQSMINTAIKKIDELGIRDALPRRHAVPTDVSINNVLFADRATQMKDVDPLLDLLATPTNTSIKGLDNAPEISIDKFISSILPNTTSLELVTGPKYTANKIAISAPVHADATNILQWDNNFSWSYNGNVTDSEISANVAAKGGKLEGILRFSLQWNESGNDIIDLDAHAVESNGAHIYYGNNKSNKTGGTLDIDVQRPNGVAVENIVWPGLVNGTYTLEVNNFSRSILQDGFRAEVVFNDTTYSYDCSAKLQGKATIKVATVTFKDGQLSIVHHIPCNESSATEFTKVSMVMLSPNHWDNNSSGNKHFIFITDNATPDIPFRGHYNEFLSPTLHDQRKVMDLLASKMMCEPNEHGLSGYGFSSTKPTTFHIKADNRLYKIKI